MNKKMIINAYSKIRTIDNTIPDDVLDFMKNASIEKLERLEPKRTVKEKIDIVGILFDKMLNSEISEGEYIELIKENAKINTTL